MYVCMYVYAVCMYVCMYVYAGQCEVGVCRCVCVGGQAGGGGGGLTPLNLEIDREEGREGGRDRS